MTTQLNRSHYIREVVLNSLRAATPYGVLHEHVVNPLVTGRIPVTEHQCLAELAWLTDKRLIAREDDGAGPRWKLSAKGQTFTDSGFPWDRLEVLD